MLSSAYSELEPEDQSLVSVDPCLTPLLSIKPNSFILNLLLKLSDV